MSYMVVSPYVTPLPCETLEQAESALYLLECVGGFGEIIEVTEEPVVVTQEMLEAVAEKVGPPKPRGRPRKAQ